MFLLTVSVLPLLTVQGLICSEDDGKKKNRKEKPKNEVQTETTPQLSFMLQFYFLVSRWQSGVCTQCDPNKNCLSRHFLSVPNQGEKNSQTKNSFLLTMHKKQFFSLKTILEMQKRSCITVTVIFCS